MIRVPARLMPVTPCGLNAPRAVREYDPCSRASDASDPCDACNIPVRKPSDDIENTQKNNPRRGSNPGPSPIRMI